jgi:predicted MFS family arabinose efflux permease
VHRAAVTTIFFLNGAAFSSWYARLPAIQDDLGLGPGLIGLALLGAPAGLLLAQPAVGGAIARRGSRPLLVLAPLFFLAVLLPALAINVATLLVAVLVAGAANGALDIAMNAQGVAVERATGTRLFTSLHAAFSFGALAGAGAAGAIASTGLEPLPHLAMVAVFAAIIAAALRPAFLRDEASADAKAARLARPDRRLAGLGAIAFCALLAEGAVFDWSSIYLDGEAGAAPGLAPLGLAAFSLTMGIGRLAGDTIAERLGAGRVASAGLVLAGAGLALALVTATPPGGLIGFALMGFGLANAFPLTLRASEGARSGPTGPALAAVSTVGYMGFLLGPPAIGLVAEATGLRASLGLVVALCVAAALLALRWGRLSRE